MVFCRNCGKEIEVQANFCPYCGATTRTYCPPPPVYRPPEPSNDRKAILLIVLVVVLVILIPIILAGVLYIMVMGFGPGTNLSPTASLITDEASAQGVNVSIVWADSSINLDDVTIDYIAGPVAGGFSVGYNLQSATNSARWTDGHNTVTYLDADGDHMLSAMDRLTISSQNGTLESGIYQMTLIYEPGGGTIGSITTYIP